MAPRRIGFVLALAVAFACRRADEVPSSVESSAGRNRPTSPATEARVQAAIEPTWTPEPQPTPPNPAVDGSVIDLPVRAIPTPIDVGAIPNFDRPRDPTPSSRAEELARCLTYRASVDPTFSSSSRVRLKVTATSTCSTWVPVEETGFEVVSKPLAGGGMAARETGEFQAPIPPRSSHVETIVEIDCPALARGCRYEVNVRSP